MPKPIARRKTKKAVAKRFKVTATGKIITSRAGRRHLASTKNRKKMRSLGKPKPLDPSDYSRIVENLPFGGR
ncbi:MAG: 50S ribosomal protein L35 [Methylacidiphilales bacterium]|nr:50S ribosomal protein L35 [Candidatus Methylacidiphilales bacterium]MDW8349723.1 50S ribosomal protein L35 [Verrucomicrobiae bacterium]